MSNPTILTTADTVSGAEYDAFMERHARYMATKSELREEKRVLSDDDLLNREYSRMTGGSV